MKDPTQRSVSTNLPGRSRRDVLLAGGTVAATALAGCLGGDDDGGTTETDYGDTEPPWTTEELLEQIEDDVTVTLYAALGEPEGWGDLVDVINDEYGTDIDLDVFVSDGGEISQRVIQERQAGSDQVDVVSQPSDIINMIHQNGPEEAEEWFETNVDTDYWFSEDLADEITHSWFVSGFNAGPTIGMPLNPTVFDERGLDRPSSYNDLFDDQYEGLETLLPGFIVAEQIGWIIGYHAEQTDMSNQEWTEQLVDHLDFTGADSHTSGARAVGEGRSPLMFYNFSNTLTQFIPEFDIEPNYVDGVWQQMNHGILSVNREAPNPWAARFLLSASLEEPVQRRLINEVDDQLIPIRTDLEYADQNPDPFTQQRLTADVTKVTFEEERDYVLVGEEARSEWIDY